MNFLKKLSGRTSPSEPKGPKSSKEVILCSNCVKSLTFSGNLGGGKPAFDYWKGNVCLFCRKVFCPKCIAIDGPTPCPQCGHPTNPATRHYLEVIYGSPELNELFKPHMPDVDILPDIDDFFTKARDALEAKNIKEYTQLEGLANIIYQESLDKNPAIGQRHVAIITPGRIIVFAPAPIPNSQSGQELIHFGDLLPSETSLQITVISYTQFEALLKDETKTKCIPFLGFLIAFAYLGHNVVVFEGHPSAFESGVRNSDVLIIDSGMLPFLEENWADIAFKAMKPNSRIFVHDRQIYSLVQIARKNSPPGWQYTAPDGEASYANVLLTTLGKMGDKNQIARITSGQSLPNPKEFTTDPEQLEYISILPFKYEKLNADTIINFIWDISKSTSFWEDQSTRYFKAKLSESDDRIIDVSFHLRLSKTSSEKQELEIKLL